MKNKFRFSIGILMLVSLILSYSMVYSQGNENISTVMQQWAKIWKENKPDDFSKLFIKNGNIRFTYMNNNRKNITSDLSFENYLTLVTKDEMAKKWGQFGDSSLMERSIAINDKTAIYIGDWFFMDGPYTTSPCLCCPIKAELKELEDGWHLTSLELIPNNKAACSLFGFFLANQVDYISTIGMPIKVNKDIHNPNLINNYTLFKLNSANDASRFLKYWVQTTGSTNPMLTRVLSVRNFNEDIVYLVLSPLTKSIFLDQPYYFDKNGNLYFESLNLGPNKKGIIQDNPVDYFYLRFYLTNKEEDNWKICIREKDKIIEPSFMKY